MKISKWDSPLIGGLSFFISCSGSPLTSAHDIHYIDRLGKEIGGYMPSESKAPHVQDIAKCPEPFCATRDDLAPLFTAQALIRGEQKEVSLQAEHGKWVMLFFYASDFTFVWPTELAAVAALYPHFRKLGVEIWGISTDSIYAHKVFTEISPSARTVQFPLLSDRNQQISRAYRVLDETSGAAFRATIFVDPEGIIASKIIYPKEVGRNAYELLRLMQGIQYGRQTGLGVPANWVPGMPGIQRDFSKVGTI